MNTRAPAEQADTVEVSWPAPDTIVLRGRPLRPGVARAELSRFAEDLWVLDHAETDAHWVGRCLHWEKFPRRFTNPIKTFALAVLDHPRPAVLTLGPPGESAAFDTLRGWTGDLLVFTQWLITQHVRRLADVTDDDLDLYRVHVLGLARSPGRRAQLLQAVRVLWAYRDHLPASCRLPGPRPWGAPSSLELADAVVKTRNNRTPRIPPETMEALLAWSLHMVEDFAPDIIGALTEHHQIQAGTHPLPNSIGSGRRHPVAGRAAAYIQQLAASGGFLPGKPDENGDIVLDVPHLARLLGCTAHRVRKISAQIIQLAQQHGVPVAPDACLGTITGLLHGTPWRSRPIGVRELRPLVRHLSAACFIVIAYLSGMRPGEALGLRRGCLTTDEKGRLSVDGHPSKGKVRNPDELQATIRTWTVVAPVAKAIAVLEQLADYPLLFPCSRWQNTRRLREQRAATTYHINKAVRAFVAWVNADFHQPGGTPVIPPDPSGRNLHAARLRRTLAYFVVRKPGGLIACGLQYGHLRTRVTAGYAGHADSGWLDDLAVERLEMIIDQIEDDLAALEAGEHVSGPAGDEYRRRVMLAAPFAGRVVNKVRNVERLLDSTDPAIHHGRAMTCVYRAETAACRRLRLDAGLPADGPDESECRPTCPNLAYTDRDINALNDQLAHQEAAAGDPLAPRPRRERAQAQACHTRSIINRHSASRRAHDDGPTTARS
ncbi:integrase [Streptomyces sp. UNOB3_S3]|uniref:integrase n=1 Tax=Streptomyces sp. UNOB3_S3 TaxID=2871682 RepID=UPI001E4E11A1|nr:integrase [Streptomyces sp. UNOB3_S3]